MIQPRTLIAALSLSAAGLVGLALNEGFTDRAVRPLPTDVPTVGFGSTFGADGKPVRMGDRITPDRALVRLFVDADKFSQAVKRCAPVPMYQRELDSFVALAYNIGPGAFCSSTLVKKLKALDYESACLEILKWNKFQGKSLAGLTARRKAEYAQCIGAA